MSLSTPISKAYAAAVAYAVIIGFSFIFVKFALRSTDPVGLLAHRFTVSFAAANLLALTGWGKFRISGPGFIKLLPIAVFYPSLFFVFQAFGLSRLPSSEAGIIQAAIPIMTMVLAALFIKEHATVWQKLCILMSVGGVSFIVVMSGQQTGTGTAKLTGYILILLSAFSSAVYNVMARKLTQTYRVAEMTYIMMGIGFVVFNAISLSQHAVRGTLADYFEPFADMRFVISILYLGLLSSLLTSYLTNYALSHIQASQMSVFINLSVLVTISAGILVLRETLAWHHFAGAVLILGGVIGVNVRGNRYKKRHFRT
ncbi:DMT family transporter [Paenibacillus glycanilyticus]|uniref:DMT family transporter n=1 Tax=Paenibacillus glycanilyticus TaxID=126569 RepID=UPI000FDC7CD2|nr:DMT family transporter [Paenibacillus glycanilyticus]